MNFIIIKWPKILIQNKDKGSIQGWDCQCKVFLKESKIELKVKGEDQCLILLEWYKVLTQTINLLQDVPLAKGHLEPMQIVALSQRGQVCL